MRTRVALATLSVFNGCLLVALAVICAVFVDGVAAPVFAGLFLAAAANLFVLARRLREPVEWG